MRALFILFLLVTLFAPESPVQAQDIFERKELGEKEALDEIERALDLEGNSEAKLNEMSSTDLINRYYKSCVTKDDPALTQFRQELICGCTTAKMQDTMSTEKIRAMFTDTTEGGFQRSLVMSFSYIPCMEEPIFDTLYGECVTNRTITASLHRPKQVCECIAKELSDFAMGSGAGILSSSSRNGIASPDALMNSTLASFMSSQTYEWKSSHITTECIYKHEYGL